MLQQTSLIMGQLSEAKFILEERKVQGALKTSWHGIMVCVYVVVVEKVACAAPISLCCVTAMNSYPVFVVWQLKGKGKVRQLSLAQQSQCMH